jgi:hypothetical protein
MINYEFDQKKKDFTFTLMEAKVLYNTCVDIVNEHPESITYKKLAKKLKKQMNKKNEQQMEFYGVNDILTIQGQERNDDINYCIEMEVQGVEGQPKNMVVFFSPEQLKLISKYYKNYVK